MTTDLEKDERINRIIAKIQNAVAAALKRSGLFDHDLELLEQLVDARLNDLASNLSSTLCSEKAQFLVFREVVSVPVNRRASVEQMIASSGYQLHPDSNEALVASMPKGKEYGEEVDVHFFKLAGYRTEEQLAEEYRMRGLIPADPYSLAAANVHMLQNPRSGLNSLIANHNGTQYRHEDGRWICADLFVCDDGTLSFRLLAAQNRYFDWDEKSWIAGIKQK